MQELSLTKTIVIRGLLSCLALLVISSITGVASAQTTMTVRVVCYNLDADQGPTYSNTVPLPGLITPYNSTTPTNWSIPFATSNLISGGVLEGIGEEIINGDPAQPIDILALEETTSNSVTVAPIVNGLNTFYAYYGMPAGYAMSTYQALTSGTPQSGGGPNALVYNTNTLQLIASVPVDPPGGSGSLGSSSGEYREVVRYEFAPAGVTPATNNEFYVYVIHAKASSGSSNDKARLGEATIIRSNEYLNLPANARVLYVGDFNIDDNSGEAGYQTYCSNGVPGIANSATGQGQGVDPLNILWGPYTSAATNINWSSSTTSTQILFMLSEEGYDLRYRDDLQIMTSNVYYDVAGGFQYVPGTYHSFGNNASLPYGSSVTANGNTALNDLDTNLVNLTSLSAAVLYQDLTKATDHLPIVADYTIPVPLSNPPTFTTSQVNETCTNQSIGSITVTASGGSGSPYTYSDNNGSSFQSGNQFTGLAAGSYTVVVKDNSGNSSTGQVVTITQPSAVTFTTSQTNETCNGQSIGSITVTASGGSGSGYTYSDNNGSSFQSGNQFTGLAAGGYTIVVKDGNGCSSTGQVVTITQPSAITFTTSQVNEPCYGQSVGSITVSSVSGGSGSGYTYSMDSGNTFQGGNEFTSLAADNYTIVVQDSLGCSSTGQVVTITQPSALSCSVSPSVATNCVNQSQVFTVNVSGGTAAYSYGWSGPNGFNATGSPITVNNLQPASAGTYTVTVTDTNGCQTACAATLAINPTPTAPTAGNNGPILAGMTLNLTASTVDGTTYSWTGPNGFTSTDQNPSISNAPAAANGTYTVTVTDSNGCTVAGSTTAVVTAMRVTSIAAASNNIYITWLTLGGTTNMVQVTPGNPGYNTNFADISNSWTIVGGSGLTSTNYVDAGGATNAPNQFYRVRLVQ
jgi:hypothetical protein